MKPTKERDIFEVTNPNELRNLVLELYGLLDWIDTADDMAKSDDKKYRKLCQHFQAKRHKFITCRGDHLYVV